MTALASSDVTVTVLERPGRGGGKKRRHPVSIAFGDAALTYPSGGVPMPTYPSFALVRELNDLILTDGGSGSDIVWKWDRSNKKLRGYRMGHVPFLIVEEAVTLTSHAGTLKYPPAYIIAATATISAATTAVHPIPTGETQATKEFTINWATGAVVFRTADSASAVKITYIPQQPSGPFSYANMIVNESVTLSSSGDVNLANRACAVQYIYQTTATAARLQFAHAAASGKVLLDIANSGNSTIKQTHADQNAKIAKVTYLKYAGLQNPGLTFVDQASIALSSEAVEFGQAAGQRKASLVLPGTGIYVIGNETTNYLEIPMGGPSVTAAAGLAKWDILVNKLTTAESSAQTSLEDTPLLILADLLEGWRGLQELTVNDAPAAQTLYGEAVGW